MRLVSKINKCILFIFLLFIMSCSSVGKRTVPDSAVLRRDEIIKISIDKVYKEYNEEILESNVGLFKKGYRDWKVILYGERTLYELQVGEDGKIVSTKKNPYPNRNKK